MILWRYKPLVIGVAGSTGKSSTKEAIYYALRGSFRVVRSEGNLNTEIGLPLTIIRGDDAKRNVFLWIKNILRAFLLFIIKNKNYPQVLVLEMSEDQPGLISYLTRLSRPKIGVISWIGEIPVHAVFYPRAESVYSEIQSLVRLLPSTGWAVLNADNPRVLAAKEKTKAQVITYGFSSSADVRISEYNLFVAGKDLSKTGMIIRLEYGGSYMPLKLERVFGQPQAYALAAATAVGLALGLNFVSVVQNLEKYKILKARTTLIKGVKNSWIFDDSYNSNPDALKSAIIIFQDLVNLIKKEKIFALRRRIMVLGDMRELGKYSAEAHKQISPLLKENADLLILVGQEMKITAEECKRIGVPPENIFWFANSKEAARKAKEIAKSGDLILVKGSRGVHLEEVTLNLMAEPQKASKYLCFEEPT